MNIQINKLTIEAPICSTCKHFYKDENGLSCRAFPNGIPSEIICRKKNHNKVLPKQRGNWVYETGNGTYINFHNSLGNTGNV
jgi:hypothetical protein